MLGTYDDLTAVQSGGADFLKSPYGTSQTQAKANANSKFLRLFLYLIVIQYFERQIA